MADEALFPLIVLPYSLSLSFSIPVILLLYRIRSSRPLRPPRVKTPTSLVAMIMMMRAASHVKKARVTSTCCIFIPLSRKQAVLLVLLPVNESSARESPRLRKTPPPPLPPSRSYRHRPQSLCSPSLPPPLSPDTAFTHPSVRCQPGRPTSRRRGGGSQVVRDHGVVRGAVPLTH